MDEILEMYRGLNLTIYDLLEYIENTNGLTIKTIDGEIYYCLNNKYETKLFCYVFKNVFILRDNLFYYYEGLRINKKAIVHMGIPQ